MKIDVSKINKDYSFFVNSVSSIIEPVNNSVIFCNEKYYKCYKDNLDDLKECVIFLPITCEKRDDKNNLYFYVENPRLEFSKFINKFINNYKQFISKNSFIGENVKLGENTRIEDFVVIDGEVIIGDNTVIKSGVKITGKVCIGKNVRLEENVVIGSTALAFEYDKENNKYESVPQLGSVVIGDDVVIAPNSTIARGAIYDTEIGKGTKIDANCYISHNSKVGKNVLIVGNTLLMGSVCVGDNSFVSGNVVIKDNTNVGSDTFIAMGAVVNEEVKDKTRVKGVPAKKF